MHKILIVDDDEKILATLAKMLTNYDICAMRATKEALDTLDKIDNIDIILFNSLKTSSPSGEDFARKVRENNPYVSMIFMSDDIHNIKNLDKLAGIGIDHFLAKPIDKKMLDVFIKNSISRRDSILSGKTPIHKKLELSVNTHISTLLNLISKKEKERKVTWKTWVTSLVN